jgi:hypothetical protein
MGRLTMSGALLSLALGASLAIPTAAQAAAKPDIPPGAQWTYFGLTYPDTVAGSQACAKEGEYLHETVPQQNLAWECRLGSPNAGVYNLWVLFETP